jgi:hypothetical protein
MLMTLLFRLILAYGCFFVAVVVVVIIIIVCVIAIHYVCRDEVVQST